MKVKARWLGLAVCLLLGTAIALAQQAAPAPQPLTFWYAYSVKPGMEAEFMNLVKTIGEPVRDKLMADGVVQAWGVEQLLLRGPDTHTHLIWFSVNDYSGVEKVITAMPPQIAKVDAEMAKAAAADPKKKAMTTAERAASIYDGSKTRDYLSRDIISAGTDKIPPAGTLPWTRYNFNKVKPGMGNAWRALWEKYNKPVFDKLVADGTVLAYGVSVEDLKTDSNFTHFVWYACKDLSGFDKVRAALGADRNRRSQEERDSIAAQFGALTEPDAVRNYISRSLIFKVAGMK